MVLKSEITYDYETELSVPTGDILRSVFVRVEIEPKNAGALIYGKSLAGDFLYVEAHGTVEKLELPFINGHIYIKYVGGLKTIKVSTLGWRDSAR